MFDCVSTVQCSHFCFFIQFLIAIELIMSQSIFFGANIALSSGNMPENIYGRTISMRVCGVSGDSGGVSNESGILINSVFGISSKF